MLSILYLQFLFQSSAQDAADTMSVWRLIADNSTAEELFCRGRGEELWRHQLWGTGARPRRLPTV